MKRFLEKYHPLLVFYLLACLFSWPFFAWRDLYPESWSQLDLHYVIKTSMVMWGPGLAAIVCGLLFAKKVTWRFSLFGSSLWRSLAFWGLPLGLWAALGLQFNGLSSHVLPLQLLLGAFIYTLGEELGWRGFMQSQLEHLPKWKRYLIIGVLWELWHFTTRTLSGSIMARIIRPLFFILPTTLLSVVIGEGTERSKSLVVAVTLHCWYNLLWEFPQTNTYIAFGVSVPFWILLLVYWDRPLFSSLKKSPQT